MICTRICRRYSSCFACWWRCANSATNSASIPVERANSRLGSLYAEQGSDFFNPRLLFFAKGHYRRISLSSPFGVKGYCSATQTAADLPTCGVINVPLAQTGEGIAECELLKWFVQEGDQVEEFQPLCEVQSDKATIEITSRYRGKVSKTLHLPGDLVKVGETLLQMMVDEDEDEGFKASEVTKAPKSSTSESDVTDSCLKEAKIGGVLSTPVVRHFAKQLGVNIEDVQGTGHGGRVVKQDVLNYAARGGIQLESSAPVNAAPAEQYLQGDQKLPEVSSTYQGEYEDKTVRLRGYQRAMVKSMTLAAKIPHFHYVDEIHCNALVKLKASFQKENTEPGFKYTFLPIFIKSLSMALSKYPFMNSCFNEELQEVILKGSHSVGIAMATPHGLVVPNIKNVQHLSILEITKELHRLQQLAQANKLTSVDISGGTITLSNIGAIGGKYGSPLINVPEVAIIAMGRIQTVPRFDEVGSVYPASVMTINIGADHRVLDGATVAKFCNEWKLFIEKPELLMLHMK